MEEESQDTEAILREEGDVRVFTEQRCPLHVHTPAEQQLPVEAKASAQR